ncbi:MAG: MBL fold metallo-hydrolase [Clostridia bacterium]|nr:MBL fold metallo-hydrolase [Clostridia bacterium]
MKNVTAYSLGAAGEVTGSKHYLEYNKKVYEIDCGAFQGNAESEERNKTQELPQPDKVILTHAHYDHSGLLPRLVKEGYEGKIYSTPATRDLTSIILMDSAKIQLHEKGKPVYLEKDAIETMDHFSCSSYKKTKKINDDIDLTFYDAGHILGSAMANITLHKKGLFCKKDLNILYTGDLGRKSNPLVNPPETKMPAPDYIFMESTYGNRTHESLDKVYKELQYSINRTVERGGKIIIPSFAVERAQEIIYFIKNLMADGKIPRIPVYVDSPMAVAATGVFSIHGECFNEKIRNDFIAKGKNPFSVKSLKFISSYDESLKIAKSKKPCIIISAQGMCEAGRIISHIKHGIENPNNTILIVGYMCEGTLGKKILDKEETVCIDGKDLKLKAEVHKIDAFSAHADYKEMLEWLSEIDTSKLKKIFIVHGDSEAQKNFSKLLSDKGFNNEIVQAGVQYKL